MEPARPQFVQQYANMMSGIQSPQNEVSKNFEEEMKNNMKRHMSNVPATSTSWATRNRPIEPHSGNMINADLYERQNTFDDENNYARHMPLLNNNVGGY